MIRAIVIFAVVIVVISEVRAQRGNGRRCGFTRCTEDECCITELVVFRSCIPLGGAGDPCRCGCADGLQCQRGRCASPETSSTVTSIPTDSSSIETSSLSSSSIETSSLGSSSTDMPTELPTPIGGN